MNHVIDFTPAGEAIAMHSDSFSLGFLGPQSITRATEIQFDAATQKWGIWFPFMHDRMEFLSDDEAQGFDTYEGARKVEVRWLNAARLQGCDPCSANGIMILQAIRAELVL